MRELEKELREEIRWKKNLGQQAKYKKNGVRSKKCSLPSDHLTKKQLKGLSGEVMTYNLRKPMKWSVFKRMPKDLQQQYLVKLRDEYDATAKAVAEMLGIQPNHFRKVLKDSNMGSIFQRNGGLRPGEAWERFLNGEPEPEQTQQEAPAPEQPEEVAAPPALETPDCRLLQPEEAPKPVAKPEATKAAGFQTTVSMQYDGPFDWYSFMQQVTKHIDDGQDVRITFIASINPERKED